MQVSFLFDVTFMAVPMLPPTKENCDKCCFCMHLCRVMQNMEICGYGGNGYFAGNSVIRTRIEDR
jgi:hypothetical protein